MGRRALLEVQRYPRMPGGGFDDYGNPVEGFGPGEPVLCYEFDPGGSNESLAEGYSDRVVTEPKLYAPYDAPFASTDEVVVSGHGRFAVDGDPARWENRQSRRQPGCVVQLRRVDG